MNLKKHGADKVAFFVLLLLGLIVAQVIVKNRSRIKLSEPVSLAHTGLSVRIPKSNGWTSTGWLYSKNSFSLLSTLKLNSRPAALVQWQYLLIPVKKTPAEQIRQRALRYNGQVADTHQKNIGSLVMDWAHITVRGKIGTVFFGVVSIGQYRTLTLEVTQQAGLGDIAEDVFETVAKSISFTDNKLLRTGAELVSNLKDGRISDILYGKGIRNYLLIKDKTGRVSGFIVENLVMTQDSNDQTTIGAVSMYSIKTPAGGSEQSVFNGSAFLDTFHWVSKDSDVQGNIKMVTDITLAQQNVVVRIPTLLSKRVEQFAFEATMVPEILLEPVLIDFLNSNYKQIVLDVIFSQGIIVPAFIDKVDIQNDDSSPKSAAYAIKINFLNEEQNHRMMYFDNYKNLVRIDVQGRVDYRIEQVGKEAILKNSPPGKSRFYK